MTDKERVALRDMLIYELSNLNLKNLGVEYSVQSPLVISKIQQTFVKRYGTKIASQSEIVKQRVIQNNLEKFGTEYHNQQHITNYDIWSNAERFKNFIANKYNQKGSFLVLNEILSYFNVTWYTLKRKLESLELLDYFYIQESNLEIDFKTFLESYNLNYERHNRSILIEDNTRREIDFLINNDIGIEINDVWSHNSLNDNQMTYKDPLYHQQKSLLAIEKRN